MKKHVLTVVFVLGLSAAVAFAQAGAGAGTAAGNAQSGSSGNYPAGSTANAPDQMGQQSAPMSEQQPGAKDREKENNKKSSSMANVDDESLHRQVHEQLASNPDLQNVQVRVKNGVVTLDGTVPKKEDRKEAKKLAKSVPGVKGVKEHLTVSASAGAAPSTTGGISGQTAGTATENPPSSQPSTGAVAGQTGATSSTTGTTTGAATSTEMGQTSTSGMGQTSAGSTAATTASPCSSLSSQAGAAGATTSGDLASQIQSEICKDPTLASSNISVSQQGNQIILSGTVASMEVKDKASDIAMKYATGMSLVNNLQVSGGQAGTPPSSAGGVGGAVGGTANPGAPSTEQPAISGQAGASTSGAQTPSVSGQAGVGAQTPESGAAQTGAQPGATMSTGDDQLKTQIETALHQEPTLSNDHINVNLTADQIELSGTVANGKGRQTAKRIAESFAGNRKVVDHLTVTGEGRSNVPPDKQ